MVHENSKICNMERITCKSLNEKIACQEREILKLRSDIDRVQYVLSAMADKMHFGREDFLKFNRKLKKYGTQEKNNS